MILYRLIDKKNAKASKFIEKYYLSYIMPKIKEFELTTKFKGQVKFQRKIDLKRLKNEEKRFKKVTDQENEGDIKENMDITEN